MESILTPTSLTGPSSISLIFSSTVIFPPN
jgi:hypothetical protein